MRDLDILKKFVDEREFRNYVQYKLYKMGYKTIKIDDERISDEDILNDNDMKGEISKTCTVQTFLNTKVGKREIDETSLDMYEEKVDFGIIISTKNVSMFTKRRAIKKNIIILGEEFFED
ncbi:MAG: restriction endonuclease [Bacilli bacterium]|nr:restriction endonuclease [Bacilli bacterium]